MTANTKHTMQLTTPSDREITLTRAFNAPSALVFEALTKPEHIRRWWGADRVDLTVCEFDARPGGQWRFAGRTNDGVEIAFFGEVREIDPPQEVGLYRSVRCSGDPRPPVDRDVNPDRTKRRHHPVRDLAVPIRRGP